VVFVPSPVCDFTFAFDLHRAPISPFLETVEVCPSSSLVLPMNVLQVILSNCSGHGWDIEQHWPWSWSLRYSCNIWPPAGLCILTTTLLAQWVIQFPTHFIWLSIAHLANFSVRVIWETVRNLANVKICNTFCFPLVHRVQCHLTQKTFRWVEYNLFMVNQSYVRIIFLACCLPSWSMKSLTIWPLSGWFLSLLLFWLWAMFAISNSEKEEDVNSSHVSAL